MTPPLERRRFGVRLDPTPTAIERILQLASEGYDVRFSRADDGNVQLDVNLSPFSGQYKILTEDFKQGEAATQMVLETFEGEVGKMLEQELRG